MQGKEKEKASKDKNKENVYCTLYELSKEFGRWQLEEMLSASDKTESRNKKDTK